MSGVFSEMLAQPGTMTAYMIFVVVACFLICGIDLQKGVEKITKVMLLLLLGLMFLLAIRSVTLPNAGNGLRFYLYPDFHKLVEYGLFESIFAAMVLPLGSLIYLLFCTSRYGWGWKNFLAEADAGSGLKFPKWARIYVSYVLPLIALFIFVQGYISKF